MRVNFLTDPSQYRHWKLNISGECAELILDVDENGGLYEGYELKLNSYDLGVDIELNDAIQRLRFENPKVKVVILKSGKDKVFCAGANIKMLGGANHADKVNFCKFTNETRGAIEDASQNSGQIYIAAVEGACAGGGYELALATEHIILVDDGSSSVSLPEVALLAVLPGTGGITRVTDKRMVRRDRADIFCSTEAGARGSRALEWNLVDDLVSPTKFNDLVKRRADEFASRSGRPTDQEGIKLGPLKVKHDDKSYQYSSVSVDLNPELGIAEITILGPTDDLPNDINQMLLEGDRFWPLRVARELDDAILQLRFNELEIGVIVFKSMGNSAEVAKYCNFLQENKDHWLAREIVFYWTRVLKRIDLTSRSLISLITPDSCFAGFLAEIIFASDRSFMCEDVFEEFGDLEASIILTSSNFGSHPMCNNLTRLATRFIGQPEMIEDIELNVGRPILAEKADALGLVSMSCDDIDWDDEVRLFLEERTSFSPDALTAMEANTRFAGPETMETKIFGRLSAWQNWIFQRPNAVGGKGALKLYGTGKRADFDRKRV
ncbi:MAG: 2,3-epoxybenzoyl-CoA dihydrolase [Pseudomonadota bacterium]|nr:2,3-epoxybenzoyl-CoA dihydrolase [Pseudomonadota bacterium]